MVRFRDTDPRPRDVSPAFERQREEIEADVARIIERMAPAHRPPNPEGYAELVDRANRRAAERYPIGHGLSEYTVGGLYTQRAAYVAGYVAAALGGDTLRP